MLDWIWPTKLHVDYQSIILLSQSAIVLLISLQHVALMELLINLVVYFNVHELECKMKALVKGIVDVQTLINLFVVWTAKPIKMNVLLNAKKFLNCMTVNALTPNLRVVNIVKDFSQLFVV